jgi:hypothetical protein
MEGARLGSNIDLESPISSKVFKNRMFKRLHPSSRTWLSLMSLTMGLTIRGYQPSFRMKSGWLLRSKVIGTSDHFRYLGVADPTTMTSRVVNFCFLLDS